MHEKKPDPGEDSGMVPNLLLLELEAQIGTLMVKRSNGQTLIILWFFAGSVVPLVPTQRATSLLTKNIDIMPNTLAGTTTLPSRFNANHQELFDAYPWQICQIYLYMHINLDKSWWPTELHLANA